MERLFRLDGDTGRIEARLEDDIWQVRASRGEKQVGTAGYFPASHRLDAEVLWAKIHPIYSSANASAACERKKSED